MRKKTNLIREDLRSHCITITFLLTFYQKAVNLALEVENTLRERQLNGRLNTVINVSIR